jgi:hemoglobin-like flavoprotein
MTPHQIALVTDSLATIDLGRLADDFYERVLAADPALGAMFVSDPAMQRIRFATELAALVRSIQDLDTFCSSAAALGARHHGYGARAGHYRLMGEQLLTSLSVALGDRWTDETAQAWTLAYDHTAEMKMTAGLSRRPG